MKIAIPLENGKCASHFGHCKCFAFIEADPKSKEIIAREDLEAPPHEPEALPNWIAEQGATLVIASGIGARAQEILIQRGLSIVIGAPEERPEILATAYLAEHLEPGRNRCDHS